MLRGMHGPIGEWDVSRVTDMWRMFYYATQFNSDVSKWDVSRVIDMREMFGDAISFNQTLCGEAWVNSTADKDEMFNDSPGSISTTECGA